MVRGNWTTISGDPEVWKKIGIAAVCMNLLLTLPIALGLVIEDLEAESERMKNKEPEGPMKGVDDPSSLFSSGIGGTLLLVAVLALYVAPAILTLFAYMQFYTMFNSEIMGFKLVSALLNGFFLISGLSLQFIIAASYPVALAQYARGKDLKPALSPFGNASAVLQMGPDYWKKAAGCAGGSIVMMMVAFHGFQWFISLVVSIGLAGVAFASLLVAARHALCELSYNM